MGTTAGTLSWEPHHNDAKFIITFQKWANEDKITYDSVYADYEPSKTIFAVDLSGFSRNTKKVHIFMKKCESALLMNDVKSVKVKISELPM